MSSHGPDDRDTPAGSSSTGPDGPARTGPGAHRVPSPRTSGKPAQRVGASVGAATTDPMPRPSPLPRTGRGSGVEASGATTPLSESPVATARPSTPTAPPAQQASPEIPTPRSTPAALPATPAPPGNPTPRPTPITDATAPPRTPPLPWPALPAQERRSPEQYRSGGLRPGSGGSAGSVGSQPFAPPSAFESGWEPLPRRADAAPSRAAARRRKVVVAAGLAVVLLTCAAIVTGIALDGDRPDTAAPVGTGSPGGAPAPAPSTPDLAAGATLVDPGAFGGDPVRFRSPTGNIGCLVGSGQARCDVTDRNWTLPPQPADCTLAWGGGLQLAGGDPARPTCAGDGVLDPSAAELGYDRAVRVGEVTCVSRRTGVECRNGSTGHGFSAARSGYAAD